MPTDWLAYAPLETPIGRHWLAATDVGLLAISRAETPDGLLPRRPRAPALLDADALAAALAQLGAYFAGASRAIDLPLDLRDAPAFDTAVWRAAQAIPYGATASYGDLAAAVGAPRAARAVGGAMARCPVAPVVPCHRVIHADGSIAGWGPELWVKRWLLDHEGWRTSAPRNAGRGR